MESISFTINHIGWITNDVQKFEKFWCGVLGFKLKQETHMTRTMALALFNINSEAVIRRYTKEGVRPDVEIHSFMQEPAPRWAGSESFGRFGINHICLHTGGKGSREEFIKQLPRDVQLHQFINPKGWVNYFIRDYEQNWIELREDF